MHINNVGTNTAQKHRISNIKGLVMARNCEGAFQNAQTVEIFIIIKKGQKYFTVSYGC